MKKHFGKKTYSTLSILSIVFLWILISIGKLDLIRLEPSMNAQTYLSLSPYITIGTLILQQPSSTFLVMTLALYTFMLGVGYLKKGKQDFNGYLGINFILWGIGAALAGLSYQAFGTYLNCSHSSYCTFTNGIELSYMMVTVYSINAIILAYRSILPIKLEAILQRYVYTHLILFSFYQGLGILLPNRFLVSYEGMLLFLSPSLLILMYLSYHYKNQEIHAKLLRIWILFLGVNAIYFIALFLNVKSFFDHYFHVWFNENDVLHITLLMWMIYFKQQIPKQENTTL